MAMPSADSTERSLRAARDRSPTPTASESLNRLGATGGGHEPGTPLSCSSRPSRIFRQRGSSDAMLSL